METKTILLTIRVEIMSENTISEEDTQSFVSDLDYAIDSRTSGITVEETEIIDLIEE